MSTAFYAAMAAIQTSRDGEVPPLTGPFAVEWGDGPPDDYTGPDLGEMGGWVDGHGWPDYLASRPAHLRPWLEALRADIIARGIVCSGDAHQHRGGMSPVVVCGDVRAVATFTMRAWGDLMAAIWNTEKGLKMNYCHFAWCNSRFETPADLDKVPNKGVAGLVA